MQDEPYFFLRAKDPTLAADSKVRSCLNELNQIVYEHQDEILAEWRRLARDLACFGSCVTFVPHNLTI